MKKNIIACLTLLMVACNVFAQAPKFSLETPAGWTRTDTTRQSSNSTLVKLSSPKGTVAGKYKEVIELLVQNISPRIEVLKDKLKEGTDFFKVTAEGHTTIANTPSYWFEITLRRAGSKITNTERYYHIEKNGVSYMFICVIPAESFSPLQPYADAVLKSLKVTE